MQKGPSHWNWKGGKRINQKGYIQITAGPYRWWLEHRMVMDKLCREFNCYTGVGGGIKDVDEVSGIRFHIHHADFYKMNNSPSNLIMIDARLHDGHMNDFIQFGKRKGEKIWTDYGEESGI